MPRTIFITGASSGIGRATALHFHAQGWQVVATMRNTDQARELAGVPGVLVTRTDVQDASSIADAVTSALSTFGSIDVLFNNAGYGAYGPIEAVNEAEMRRQFDVNVFGLLRTTQALLPHFRRQRRGLVINVSSIGGRFAFPLGTLYHGSKFAVEGISEAMRYELMTCGIQVKIIEPGMIRTDFAGRSFAFLNDPALEEYQALVGRFLDAMGPMTESASPPETVASVVYSAATDEQATFRYTAGADAAAFIGAREAQDDATFLAGIGATFGIPTPITAPPTN